MPPTPAPADKGEEAAPAPAAAPPSRRPRPRRKQQQQQQQQAAAAAAALAHASTDDAHVASHMHDPTLLAPPCVATAAPAPAPAISPRAASLPSPVPASSGSPPLQWRPPTLRTDSDGVEGKAHTPKEEQGDKEKEQGAEEAGEVEHAPPPASAPAEQSPAQRRHVRQAARQPREGHQPMLRKVHSLMSGNEADSEPSTGGSSVQGSSSAQQLSHLQLHLSVSAGGVGPPPHARPRPKSHSIDMLPGASGVPLFSADRLHGGTTYSASASPAGAASYAMGTPSSFGTPEQHPYPAHSRAPWKVSSSSLNLLLSSHLSKMYVPTAPPLSPASQRALTPDAAATDSRPSLLRRIFSPFVHWSPRGTLATLVVSLLLARIVRRSAAPIVRHRTMLTFAPYFLVREAPHLFMLGIVLAMLRTAHQQRAAFPCIPLLLSWAVNAFSLTKLAGMFALLLRGAEPFRRQMAAAGIRMPHQLPAAEESVLTIAPAGRSEQGDVQLLASERTLAETVVEDAGTPAAGLVDASSADAPPSQPPSSAPASAVTTAVASPPSDPSSLSPSPAALAAYRRIGHMGPLRWFLTATQLTKPLAWAEGIQWRTGVVYERLYTRHKTRALKLDIYRPKGHTVSADRSKPFKQAPLPVFLYIHGGGWITGHRSFHSLTLLYAIAKAGFLVCSVNYRLSPWVKHPTHLMDCKRALTWIRTHSEALGADPSCVIVGGESAGAHLACMLALTPNIPYLQPGSESIDTSVQGCVDLYGPHDFTDESLHYRCHEDPTSWLGGFDSFLQMMVMGMPLHDSAGRAQYAMASPLHRLRHFGGPARDIPPFFGTHGAADDLVPCGDSDEFYAALKGKREQAQREYEAQMREYEERRRAHASSSSSPPPQAPAPLFPPHDVYVRVPGASHAYNNVMGPRAFALNDSVTAWILSARAHHKERQAKAKGLDSAAHTDARAAEPPLQLMGKL